MFGNGPVINSGLATGKPPTAACLPVRQKVRTTLRKAARSFVRRPIVVVTEPAPDRRKRRARLPIIWVSDALAVGLVKQNACTSGEIRQVFWRATS